MAKNLFFLLGAPDPEMQRMEDIIRNRSRVFSFDCTFEYARNKDGQRVSAASAYHARMPEAFLNGAQLVCVECRPADLPDNVDLLVIDHHRPGDPGYELGADRYWEASSLGQLCTLLGVIPTQEDRVIAAVDHCFVAALAAKCPGVSPVEAERRRNDDILDSHKARFVDILYGVPRLMLGGQQVFDLREVHLGEGYTTDLLVMQSLLASRQLAGLLRHSDVHAGEKVTLSGAVSPETVKAFLEEWVGQNGLERAYGVPVRGYAGAYFRANGTV